ncbi:LacI family DNA-binding transcriptional regulator [Brevibacillus fulvus]|uniref:LacI family transcriptional regulator n=1 Tax=Brevibacillus fulvus TaxID=1125967 RepID=A0A939BNR4_9BACL|nr:LacI family DNA-binding transcriptional regulator [Brevibacillus fulvus]MBM7589515.1 LacI family transcriptional regulator [Brevibacillus fulvus]
MPKKRSRVTLQDVANHAGVSRATASLIVRGANNVSETTRQKVLKSIEELGYVYDRTAANLRSNQSNTVALIITDIGNPYFSQLLIGVHRALDKEGYNVILGTTQDSLEKQEMLLSTMLEYRIAGIIISPVLESSEKTLALLQRFHIPIVLATRRIANHGYDYVGIDYLEGAKIAVKHLLDKGHRRIAYIGGPTAASSWWERREGYCQALDEAGIEFDEQLVKEGPASAAGGYQLIRDMLELPNPPTAVFCYNDLVAFGVMTRLREVGLTPGAEFPVVGFDNIPESSMIPPGLTTVSGFPRLIGTYAAELLHQRIHGLQDEPKRVIFHPELIVRGSG